MKKIIYLKHKIEVEIGDLIDLDEVSVRVTQELINDNPKLFEVKDIPEYVKYLGCSSYDCFNIGEIYLTSKDVVVGCNYRCILDSCTGAGQTIYPKEEIYFSHSSKEEFDKQELLKEAKKRYKKGHKIFSVISKTAKVCDGNIYINNSYNVIAISSGNVKDTSNIDLYYNGKWATKLEKLFVTKDGVDLYKGDEYWYSCSNNLCCCRSIAGNNPCSTNEFPHYKILFSTKEACEEYNKENEPKALKDYEDALFMSENTGTSVQDSVNKDYNDFYRDFKIHEPKLYWHNILISIASDLNCEFKEKRYYCIKKKDGCFMSEEIDYHRNTFMDIEFSSMEICNKAIEIMGDKLKYLF